MQHLIGEEKERTLVRAVLSLFLLVTKRLYGKEWEWSIGQIKTCRKKQHVEIDDRKEMPDLFCGKAAVGGNYNLMRDILVDSLSEFDEKLRFVIMKFCSSYSRTKKEEEINKYAYRLIVKQLDDNKGKCDTFKGNNFLTNSLTNSYLVDSAKLAQIVQHIFNKHYPEQKYRKDFYDTYLKKIITERNNLAHAKKETAGDGLFYFEKDGVKIVYDSVKCSEIRSNINSFDKEIGEMIELIV